MILLISFALTLFSCYIIYRLPMNENKDTLENIVVDKPKIKRTISNQKINYNSFYHNLMEEEFEGKQIYLEILRGLKINNNQKKLRCCYIRCGKIINKMEDSFYALDSIFCNELCRDYVVRILGNHFINVQNSVKS